MEDFDYNLGAGLPRGAMPTMNSGREAFANPVRDSKRVMLDIPDGPMGTRMTLGFMKKLANSQRTSLELQSLVDSIVRNAPEKNFRREAELIHNYVRDRIRYQKDPPDYEAIHSPLSTLARGAGDCDDKVILECALLKAAGHECRFVAVSLEPDYFSHVFVQTLIGREWVSSDPTESQPFGWEPQDGVIGRIIVDV